MRATKDHSYGYDIVLTASQQRFFEAQSKRLGITVPEAIALSAELAMQAGLDLPEKEGKILPFEALKSAHTGPIKA